MHIFLTGEIQVGKSTIIKKLLDHTGQAADGFLTFWESADDGGRRLFLSPYSADTGRCEKFQIARSTGDGLVREPNISEVFDVHGTEILRNSGRRDVVIMDELGFLESDAMVFQKTVLSLLETDVPILGVIKPRRTKFLDAVREHPKSKIFMVNVENRDAVFSNLLSI